MLIVAFVALVLIGVLFATRGNSSEARFTNDTTPVTEATDSPTDLTLQSPSPSGLPSSSPTTAFLKYPRPSQEDCNAVELLSPRLR